MAAELDGIEVRRGPDPQDQHQLVLRAVERSHPGVRLVPDAEIEEIAIDRPADCGHALDVSPVDADKVHCAIAGNPGAGAEGIGEKAPERRRIHLARGHGELGVPTLRIGMAIDPDVVGRIEEGGIDRRAAAHHRPQEGKVAPVAAADPVLTEDPDIAGPGAGDRRDRRDHFVLGIGRTFQDHVDLAGREAGQRQVEIDVEHRQFGQLDLEEIEVPAGAERDPVVGDP